jgi:signal peptidase II
MNRNSVRILFLTAAVFAATLDLWSKSAAFAAVRASADDRVTIIPGRFELIERLNTAGIWSLGFGHESSNLILKIVGVGMVVGVFCWGLWLVPPNHRWTACLLGFILGGAVGNVYDRFAHDGVRDFIQVYLLNNYAYPTFNVADSFLMCSMAALIFGQWRTGSPADAKKAPALAS